MEKFEFLGLERKEGSYLATILFDGHTGRYQIETSSHLSYIPELSPGLRFHILNCMDMGFNGDGPKLKISGLDRESVIREKRLEKALMEFAREHSSLEE